MIIALLIAAAPSLIVSSVQHRAPPIVTPLGSSPEVLTPDHVRVRVTAGNRELYSGALRVTRNASASYSENLNEAPETVCANNRYSGSTERHSLSVQVNLRDDEQSGQAVHVSVEWKRPAESSVCGGEASRAVEMVQTVPLAPGQSATLHGDAGLTVTVSR